MVRKKYICIRLCVDYWKFYQMYVFFEYYFARKNPNNNYNNNKLWYVHWTNYYMNLSSIKKYFERIIWFDKTYLNSIENIFRSTKVWDANFFLTRKILFQGHIPMRNMAWSLTCILSGMNTIFNNGSVKHYLGKNSINQYVYVWDTNQFATRKRKEEIN